MSNEGSLNLTPAEAGIFAEEPQYVDLPVGFTPSSALPTRPGTAGQNPRRTLSH